MDPLHYTKTNSNETSAKDSLIIQFSAKKSILSADKQKIYLIIIIFISLFNFFFVCNAINWIKNLNFDSSLWILVNNYNYWISSNNSFIWSFDSLRGNFLAELEWFVLLVFYGSLWTCFGSFMGVFVVVFSSQDLLFCNGIFKIIERFLPRILKILLIYRGP